MRKMWYWFGLLTIMLVLCSCATIMNGRSQQIRVDSNVHGATVRIDNVVVGYTPFVGEIPRGRKNRVITVEAPDGSRQPQMMLVGFDQMKSLGNLLLGLVYFSLFSMTTDYITGAVYEYSPDAFYFHLLDEYGNNTDEMLIRKYAMLYHSQIAIDTQNEKGEFINTLADMMNSSIQRAETITHIQTALEISQGDQLVFGDEIIYSFRRHH